MIIIAALCVAGLICCGVLWWMMNRVERDDRVSDLLARASKVDWSSVQVAPIDAEARVRELQIQIAQATFLRKKRSHLEAELRAIRHRQLGLR